MNGHGVNGHGAGPGHGAAGHNGGQAAAAPEDGAEIRAAAPASAFGIIAWHEQPRQAGEPGTDTACLLLAPADPAACQTVTIALHRAGLRPAVVRPGPAYGQTAAGFTARPADPDDLAQVLATLAGRGVRPRLLVHALSLTAAEPVTAAEADAQLGDTVYSLLAMLQAGARHPISGRPPAAMVVTSRSADVTGAEPVDPVKATMHGFARSVIKAAPELGCRIIDVAEPDPDELAAEVALWPRHEIVALRGSRRWTARTTAFAARPTADGGTAVRRHGVYLLTGGPGGLGMAVARALAETGLQPRIALLSRRGLPDEAADDRASRIRAQIAELESLGSRVRVIACDVTDRRGLRRALDTVTADFGPVHGVIHLAGVPGDSQVHLRTAQQAGQVSADSVRPVLAAKVHGTLALAEALRGRPPVDFFVCFSSRAATDGLLGSGDYAAANAFQDAYTTVLRRAGVPALSVNWPSWAEVGMAAEYGQRVWAAEYGSDNCPLMDEHRIDGQAVMPGTGQVDLLLRGYRAITGSAGPVRLREIVFHQMMKGDERRRLEVRLHPDGQLETWSRQAADPAAGMVRHASARVSRVDQVPPQQDLAALRSRLPALLADDGPETHLFRLGPRFDNLVRTWISRPDEVGELLVEMALPAEFAAETAEHAAYPTLLDTAITAVRRPEDGPHLPLLCDSLELYQELPATLLAHVRRTSSGPGIIRSDINLLTPDGALVARVIGCTLRKFTGQPFSDADGGPAAGGRPAAGAGIDPRHGARLFLTLLRSRHPGQVLVGRDGAEVFAAPGAAEAAPVRADGTTPPDVRPNGLPTAPLSAPEPPRDGRPPEPMTVPEAESVPEVAPVSEVAPVPEGGSPADPGPGDSLEERLTAIWAEAIGDPSIELDADFFEVGGNSLTAVALMSHITEAFGVDLTLAALFDHPTIRGLSQALRLQGAQ